MKKYFIFIFLLSLSINAQEWQYVGFKDFSVISFDINPMNTNEIYVGTASNFSLGYKGKLLKSIDGGVSIDTLLTEITAYTIYIEPQKTRIVYAGLGTVLNSPPGLLKTTDSGETWNFVNNGLIVNWETHPSVVVSDPSNIDHIFTGTVGFYGGKVYESFDGGDNWEQVDILDNIHEIYYKSRSEILVGASTRLYRTTDNGQEWTLLYNFELNEAYEVKDIVGYRDTLYVVSQARKMIKSTDGGMNWLDINNGIDVDQVNKVLMDPNNPSLLYCLSYYGIYKTTNGGNQWELLIGAVEGSYLDKWKMTDNGKTIYCSTGKGLYKLDLITEVYDDELIINEYELHQNYPNPFNPSTEIRFSLAKTSFVDLTVYNMLGQKVKTLVREIKEAGHYSINFNASGLSAGTYIYKIATSEFTFSRKMILMK